MFNFIEEEYERRQAVLEEVSEERTFQDSKWGLQNHVPYVWLAILTEEVGEVAQEILRSDFAGKSLSAYRAELVQVAAVAVAAIQNLDRDTEASVSSHG